MHPLQDMMKSSVNFSCVLEKRKNDLVLFLAEFGHTTMWFSVYISDFFSASIMFLFIEKLMSFGEEKQPLQEFVHEWLHCFNC